MHQLDQAGKSILVSRLVGFRNSEVRTIDVWWSGTQENGDLMLLLAHLLMQSRRWRRSSIRLKTVVSDSAEIGERQAALHRICKDTQINAEPIVLKPNEGQSIPELIRQIRHKRTWFCSDWHCQMKERRRLLLTGIKALSRGWTM